MGLIETDIWLLNGYMMSVTGYKRHPELKAMQAKALD
jgi:hypothetical protein